MDTETTTTQPAALADPNEMQPPAQPATAQPEVPAAPVEPAAPEAPVATAVDPIEDFKKKYQALVAETGYSINVEPKYLKQEDGSYKTVLETTILPVR